MPFLDFHYTSYNIPATSVEQPGDRRAFKSHMTIHEIRQFGVLPSESDMVKQYYSATLAEAGINDEESTKLAFQGTSLLPTSPTISLVEHPRVIYCYRNSEDMIYSIWRFFPTFTHIHPDRLSFNQAIAFWLKVRPEAQRLQSLVDFWRVRHHPNIFVCYSSCSHAVVLNIDPKSLLLCQQFNFFEDAVTDHEGTIRRMAHWMNIDIDDNLLRLIKHQTSHS
jgi:hypothetical protein